MRGRGGVVLTIHSSVRVYCIFSMLFYCLLNIFQFFTVVKSTWSSFCLLHGRSVWYSYLRYLQVWKKVTSTEFTITSSIELFGRYVIAYYFEQLWVKYHLSKQYCIFFKVSWLHIRLAILMELYGNTLFMLGTSCEFYYYFSIIIIKLLYLNIIAFFTRTVFFFLVQDE